MMDLRNGDGTENPKPYPSAPINVGLNHHRLLNMFIVNPMIFIRYAAHID